jgi:hypothetical protein
MKKRILSVCSFISLMQVGSASVVFQLSAPGVQQSSFQADGSYLTETFDSLASLAASGTLAVGNYTASGPMKVVAASKYGGAGGTGKYAVTDSNGELSVALGTPSKYIGLWFTCSNPGNYIDVYSGANLLATFDTQSLDDIVGLKASPNSVLASDGNYYSGDLWYGNPNPGLNDSDVGRFVYAYVNMGLSDPNATFDRIVMRGAYFEFDNLTTSSSSFVSVVPEPAGCATLAGVLMLGFSMSRRRAIGSDRILQGGN